MFSNLTVFWWSCDRHVPSSDCPLLNVTNSWASSQTLASFFVLNWSPFLGCDCQQESELIWSGNSWDCWRRRAQKGEWPRGKKKRKNEWTGIRVQVVFIHYYYCLRDATTCYIKLEEEFQTKIQITSVLFLTRILAMCASTIFLKSCFNFFLGPRASSLASFVSAHVFRFWRERKTYLQQCLCPLLKINHFYGTNSFFRGAIYITPQ